MGAKTMRALAAGIARARKRAQDTPAALSPPPPLKAKLGAKAYERLLKALSIIYGIEPYTILKDIWGLSNREVERTALWMADALLDAALRDAAALAPPRKAPVCRDTAE